MAKLYKYHIYFGNPSMATVVAHNDDEARELFMSGDYDSIESTDGDVIIDEIEQGEEVDEVQS